MCESHKIEIERLQRRVSELVAALDVHYGTPCEEIRHQQEIERLTLQVRRCGEDGAKMLAEIERLQSQLTKWNDWYGDQPLVSYEPVVKKQAAEIERLKGEHEALRQALFKTVHEQIVWVLQTSAPGLSEQMKQIIADTVIRRVANILTSRRALEEKH